MNYTDPLIIYLAVGAPVAMHRFFQLERPISIRTLLIVGFTLVVWPLEAFRIVARHRERKLAEHSYLLTRENSSETIIAAAEKFEAEILDAAGSFRSSVRSSQAEALDRYIGLAAVWAAGVPAGSSAREFLSASGSRDEKIGVQCLIRRNRRLLWSHLTRARADILKEFFADGGSPADSLVRVQFLGLAEVLKDNALSAALAETSAAGDKEELQWRRSSDLTINNEGIQQPQPTI
jgi:hypothetical protein